jgi:hypothetical protein
MLRRPVEAVMKKFAPVAVNNFDIPQISHDLPLLRDAQRLNLPTTLPIGIEQ